jgi:hypothetical protein
MSCNMAWAAQLLEKKSHHSYMARFFFSGNRAALAGYVVHNSKLSNTDFKK